MTRASSEGAAGASGAGGLRRAFDRSFAEPPRADVARLEDLLAIRVATAPYAVRLAEVAGLFADKKVTPLPSAVSELLGVAGFRGVIVPVYDLRALLGYPLASGPRSLVVLASARVAVAFDATEGHFRVPPDAIAPGERPGLGGAHVREVVCLDEGMRPVLSLSSLLEAIRSLGRALSAQKDR